MEVSKSKIVLKRRNKMSDNNKDCLYGVIIALIIIVLIVTIEIINPIP